MPTYTLRDVASRLGLSRAVIVGLIEAGFVTPARGPRREYRFSFQDMVLLRAAQGLSAARIPPRRIVQSLRQLRARLPEQMPLSGLRLEAIGSEVVVREGGTPWRADSGQLLFDFEAATADGAPVPAQVHTLRRGPGHAAGAEAQGYPAGADTQGRRPGADALGHPTGAETPIGAAMPAASWLERAAELEATNPAAAETAYRRALHDDATQVEAYINLGVLLASAGRHAEAIALYRTGIERCAPEALLHYNLAVALEDSRQPEAAIAAYDRCLALDPQMADAHFNVARLHDQLGRAKSAIRHYSAYRRLRKGAPG
jgi:hypothetical protein